MKKEKMQNILMECGITIFAIVLAIFAGAVVMLLFGYEPLAAYSALLKGAFGTVAATTSTLTKSVPIMLTGLAVAVAFKCGVFNIGAEGQLLMGALFAGIAGIYVDFLPAVLHIPLTLAAAVLGGMIWAFIPAVMKQKFQVNVVIGTIMFNYIGEYFVQYMILNPMKAEGVATATNPLSETALLPKILTAPNVLNLGYPIAILVAFAMYYLMQHTVKGYEMRAVGINPVASRWNGIAVEKNMFAALVLSGALAGLAGGIEVTGSLGKVVVGASSGYGFTGISVALIAHNNPIVIIFSALLLAAMKTGSMMMQTSAGVSKNMVDLVQGLIIVFLCAEYVFRYVIKKYFQKQGGEKSC